MANRSAGSEPAIGAAASIELLFASSPAVAEPRRRGQELPSSYAFSFKQGMIAASSTRWMIHTHLPTLRYYPFGLAGFELHRMYTTTVFGETFSHHVDLCCIFLLAPDALGPCRRPPLARPLNPRVGPPSKSYNVATFL